jgi:hypothetical protein
MFGLPFDIKKFSDYPEIESVPNDAIGILQTGENEYKSITGASLKKGVNPCFYRQGELVTVVNGTEDEQALIPPRPLPLDWIKLRNRLFFSIPIEYSIATGSVIVTVRIHTANASYVLASLILNDGETDLFTVTADVVQDGDEIDFSVFKNWASNFSPQKSFSNSSFPPDGDMEIEIVANFSTTSGSSYLSVQNLEIQGLPAPVDL